MGLFGGMMLAVAREVMNESVKASVDKLTVLHQAEYCKLGSGVHTLATVA